MRLHLALVTAGLALSSPELSCHSSPVNEHGGRRSESPAVGLDAAPDCAVLPAARKRCLAGISGDRRRLPQRCWSLAVGGFLSWQRGQAVNCRARALGGQQPPSGSGTSPGTGWLRGPARSPPLALSQVGAGGLPSSAHVPSAATVPSAPTSGSRVTLAPSAPCWGRPLPGRGCWVLAESMNKISP